MTLSSMYLFKEVSAEMESEILNNANKGTIMVLQVKCDGNFDLVIEGCVDISRDEYSGLASINMGNLTKTESINTSGIYKLDISGCRKIKANIKSIGNSPLTVYAIVKEG